MASPTYSTRALVLRKTKLGESDLILSLLNEDGSQFQVVAKGARKPTSSFASRLELFCVVDILCSKGRSLDIVKEARLLEGNEPIRFDVAKSTAAAPMAELLCKLAQPGLENSILFDASCVAFKALANCNPGAEPSVCAAFLLKSLAYCGFRPSFSQCACCGSTDVSSFGSMVRFSFSEGGCLCGRCGGEIDSTLVPSQYVSMSSHLLHMRFNDLLDGFASTGDALSVMGLCRDLILVHVGGRLKSLEFLLTQAFIFDGTD